MPQRAVLFIDYQNAYRNALDLFHGAIPAQRTATVSFTPGIWGWQSVGVTTNSVPQSLRWS